MIPDQPKPREWWIYEEDGQAHTSSTPGATHVIEYAAFEKLRAKHEELLSYLPKVPSEPHEKDMAKEIAELRAERDELQDLLGLYLTEYRNKFYLLNEITATCEKYRALLKE